MKRSHKLSQRPAKRRTTLTLPADSLKQVELLAAKRNVNLSTLVAEAIDEKLRAQAMADRADQIIENYRKAFAGFTEDELMILDGIVPDPKPRRPKAKNRK